MHLLKKCILTTFGLNATLNFDLLTSKTNQFVFLNNCTEVVNLVKFTQMVHRVQCLVYDHRCMQALYLPWTAQ